MFAVGVSLSNKKHDHPYGSLGPESFWRSAVAETGVFGLESLWKSKWSLPKDALFATFGSCFAQHISRALVSRKMNWFNAEPAPGRTPDVLARKFNYGIFSARTGNIYTAKQLVTWVELASGDANVQDIEIWEDPNGRFWDMLRPGIEPNGFESIEEARASLTTTAEAFKKCITDANVFVFTLGLTEGWINTQTKQAYALCPGTTAGDFDPEKHQFVNYRYAEIMNDLESAFVKMRELNPEIHVLLTVSPVPLVATASGDHVLLATQYSKSVLRAVAGDAAASHSFVDYFPSYEIIASPSMRGTFFEPNMRGVAPQGVEHVMGHFFSGLDLTGDAQGRKDHLAEARAEGLAKMKAEELVCEEMILEDFNDA